MKMKRLFVSTLLGLVFLAGIHVAALPQEAETKSEVPELWAFHEIIYPIWHNAYPKKDYQALRSYVPKVNELAAKVYAAPLPGILRDKKDKWAEGVAQLRKAVDYYAQAAAGKDDQALLNAAEALHARFESLARIIIPVIPELDAFHQVLYVIYHKYAPDKAYDKIRSVTPELLAKAEAVVKAKLPSGMSEKKDAFQKAAAALLEAVQALDAAGKARDRSGMDKGIETVHSCYQALEKLFEGVHIAI
jgi:hypothetical protein